MGIKIEVNGMTTEIYKGWTYEVAPAGQIAITANDEATKAAYLSQMQGGKPERIATIPGATHAATLEKVRYVHAAHVPGSRFRVALPSH